MKFTIFMFLFSMICLAPSYVSGQEKGDHLLPVDDAFNLYEWQAEYFSNIRNLLFEQGFSLARIRILSLPAFGKERSLEVTWSRSKESGYIIKRVPKERIWQHEDPDSISVDQYIIEINRSDYELLYELFKRSVNKTRYQGGGTKGLDGYRVYFMVWDGGWKSGQTWSPKGGTKMKRLVDIYQELSKQTEEEKSPLIISDSLYRHIENLEKEFE